MSTSEVGPDCYISHMGISAKDAIDRVKEKVYESSHDGIEATRNEGLNSRNAVAGVKDAVFGVSQEVQVGQSVIRKDICDASHGGVDATRSEGRWLDSKVGSVKEAVHNESRFIDKGISDIRRDVDGVKLDACKNTDELGTKIAETSALVQMKLCDISKDQWTLAKDAQLFAAQNTSSILLDSSKNAAAGQLEAAKNFYALTVQATMNAAASTLQATTNFSAMQLLAEQNRNAISKEIAECCCETKLMMASQAALILADGQKTRDLVNATEMLNLRDRLLDEKHRSNLLSFQVGNGNIAIQK